jgi:hypothetical protein
MINENSYQYWPFPVDEAVRQLPEVAQKIEFLAGVYSDGFKAFQEVPGESLYGAMSETRSGEIIQRSFRGNRWELRLSENLERRLVAFVTDFDIAGKALRAWLNGQSEIKVLEDIREYLTLLSGLKNSYTLYTPKDK